MKINKYLHVSPKENIMTIFSVEGVYSQQAILWVFSLIYILRIAVDSFNILLLSYVVTLLLFCPGILAVQKRCRDFGQNGTWEIICYTLFLILMCVTDFVKSIEHTDFNTYLGYIKSLLGIAILIMCVIPSQKNPNLEVRSPLLKYPFLYIMICWLISVGTNMLVYFVFR